MYLEGDITGEDAAAASRPQGTFVPAGFRTLKEALIPGAERFKRAYEERSARLEAVRQKQEARAARRAMRGLSSFERERERWLDEG